MDKESNTNYASGAATVSPAKRERAATMASESRRAGVKTRSQTLIFDIGGCSVRAGFAGGKQDVGAAWPEVYFPAVVSSKAGAVGFDALVPENRRASRLTWPLRNTDFMEQGRSKSPPLATDNLLENTDGVGAPHHTAPHCTTLHTMLLFSRGSVSLLPPCVCSRPPSC